MYTIDQKLVDLIQQALNQGDWPWGNLLLCVIALFLCTILVGFIGFEREYRGRSAGLRTHLLVGVGSTILMIISIYGFPMAFETMNRDVARLAAQIITGVGFLGAGAIIHRNSGIKGLTTAGTIWASMAIGIACGSFNFIIALLGTGLIVIVLTVFKKIENRISSKNPTIVVVTPSSEPVLEKILKTAADFDCMVHNINSEMVENDDSHTIQTTFQVSFANNDARIPQFMARLEKELNAVSIHSLSHIQ